MMFLSLKDTIYRCLWLATLLLRSLLFCLSWGFPCPHCLWSFCPCHHCFPSLLVIFLFWVASIVIIFLLSSLLVIILSLLSLFVAVRRFLLGITLYRPICFSSKCPYHHYWSSCGPCHYCLSSFVIVIVACHPFVLVAMSYWPFGIVIVLVLGVSLLYFVLALSITWPLSYSFYGIRPCCRLNFLGLSVYGIDFAQILNSPQFLTRYCGQIVTKIPPHAQPNATVRRWVYQ